MRILMVHNKYGSLSGEEVMVSNIATLLREHGHEVYCFFRSSEEILDSFWLKAKAFFSGIYSFSSRKQIRQVIIKLKPDIVEVQNVYPLISPSILEEAAVHRIPVVMRCANYRLICPNGLFMTKGQICERCSGGREWWCLLRNCEDSQFKSLGYALRNYYAHKQRLFLDNVTIYLVLTKFQRQRFIHEGFPKDRIVIIPNMVYGDRIQASSELGNHVGYVGRVSPEKGVLTFVEAAQMCRDLPFKIAGLNVHIPDLPTNAPSNIEFCGHLKAGQLDEFYRKSRIIILPSICYETFGLTLAEAALWGKPVICSRIGGLPEIVEDGVTGLLFQPGDAHDLKVKIRYLWDRPDLCLRMGQAGRAKVLHQYSPQKFYESLMKAYEKAMRLVHTNHR